MKTIARWVAGLLALVLVVIGGLVVKGSLGLRRVRDIPFKPIAVVSDSSTIAHGKHLAQVIMKCSDCHGGDLGGRNPFADARPLGVVNGPNLTTGEGGSISRYDDPALARAIRHGIKVDGRPILLMPAGSYLRTSEADVAAVIAYVRSVPPIDRTIPPSQVHPVGRLLYALGQFPIVEADRVDHAAAPSPNQAPAPTVEYGQYLADIGGCTGCHGPGLSGGKIPGTPPEWKPASNITPLGLKGWTEADFVTALKTGIRPNKTPIDTIMPWRFAGQMDSTEMRAVWLFLQSVPEKAFGGR